MPDWEGPGLGVGLSKEHGWLRYRRGVQVNLPYHIRVLVPCYKESFDIVTRTIMVSSYSLI